MTILWDTLCISNDTWYLWSPSSFPFVLEAVDSYKSRCWVMQLQLLTALEWFGKQNTYNLFPTYPIKVHKCINVARCIFLSAGWYLHVPLISLLVITTHLQFLIIQSLRNLITIWPLFFERCTFCSYHHKAPLKVCASDFRKVPLGVFLSIAFQVQQHRSANVEVTTIRPLNLSWNISKKPFGGF